MSISLSLNSVSKLKTVDQLTARVSKLQGKASHNFFMKEKAAKRVLREKSLNFHAFRIVVPTDRYVAIENQRRKSYEQKALPVSLQDLLVAIETEKFKGVKLSVSSCSDLMSLVKSNMSRIPIPIFPKLIRLISEQGLRTSDSFSVVLGVAERIKESRSTCAFPDYSCAEWVSVGISLNQIPREWSHGKSGQIHRFLCEQVLSLYSSTGVSETGSVLRYLEGVGNPRPVHEKLFKRVLDRVREEIDRTRSFQASKPIFCMNDSPSADGNISLARTVDFVGQLFQALEVYPQKRRGMFSFMRVLNDFLQRHSKLLLPQYEAILVILGKVCHLGFAPLPVSHILIGEYLRKQKRLSNLSQEALFKLSNAIQLTGYRDEFGTRRVHKLYPPSPAIQIRLSELVANRNFIYRLKDEEQVRVITKVAHMHHLRPFGSLIRRIGDLMSISRLSLEMLEELSINENVLSPKKRQELGRALAFHKPP